MPAIRTYEVRTVITQTFNATSAADALVKARAAFDVDAAEGGSTQLAVKSTDIEVEY